MVAVSRAPGQNAGRRSSAYSRREAMARRKLRKPDQTRQPLAGRLGRQASPREFECHGSTYFVSRRLSPVDILLILAKYRSCSRAEAHCFLGRFLPILPPAFGSAAFFQPRPGCRWERGRSRSHSARGYVARQRRLVDTLGGRESGRCDRCTPLSRPDWRLMPPA